MITIVHQYFKCFISLRTNGFVFKFNDTLSCHAQVWDARCRFLVLYVLDTVCKSMSNNIYFFYLVTLKCTINTVQFIAFIIILFLEKLKSRLLSILFYVTFLERQSEKNKEIFYTL